MQELTYEEFCEYLYQNREIEFWYNGTMYFITSFGIDGLTKYKKGKCVENWWDIDKLSKATSSIDYYLCVYNCSAKTGQIFYHMKKCLKTQE